jgi:hypothetical protein
MPSQAECLDGQLAQGTQDSPYSRSLDPPQGHKEDQWTGAEARIAQCRKVEAFLGM